MLLRRAVRRSALSLRSLPSRCRATSGGGVRVLLERDGVVAVAKPPGLQHHAVNAKEGEPGVVEAAREALGGFDGRLYACHRLDAGTSGVLLLAKTKEAAAAVARAFRERRVSKYYVAVGARGRKPSKKKGCVRGDQVPGRRGAWRLVRSAERPAVTGFVSAGANDGLRAFLLHPQTGRTHQIRVAMKSLGCPVLGDALYGDAVAAGQIDRMYLHALAVRLTLAGRPFQVVCPPSGGVFDGDGFREALGRMWPGLEAAAADEETWFPEDKHLRSELFYHE